MDLGINYYKLKNGISGLLRVRNDAIFIESCVDSCIDALDELIIIYNDCTDNSEEIINRCKKKYPHKIYVYKYPYKVLSSKLSEEEFNFVMSLPEDSKHLLSSYYNFGLSKVQYKYAMKIDADQIYFTDKLIKLCNIYRKNNKLNIHVILGFFISILYYCRFVSKKIKFSILQLPFCYKNYIEYTEYMACKGKVLLSISGINIILSEDNAYVPLGNDDKDDIGLLPPFNGVTDHLIFKVTPQTYYKRWYLPTYNAHKGGKNVIEKFHYQGKILKYGFMWFHLNMMRSDTYKKYKYQLANTLKFIRIDNFHNYKIDETFKNIKLNASMLLDFAIFHANEKKDYIKYKQMLYNFFIKIYHLSQKENNTDS